jgi:CheY-like chemotaxis protein
MPKVLIVDDEPGLAHLVSTILIDEGYQVSVLSDTRPEMIRAAVGRLEPDCILLDSAGRAAYGGSWVEAAWLHDRARPVPTIMFTAHAQAEQEAREGESPRSRAAAFTAILPKPFDLDDLLETVARCTALSASFERSARETSSPPPGANGPASELVTGP